VSFTTIEAAAKARLESKSVPFKGVLLYVAQFETKAVREAHIAEARDKRELENYKKRAMENNKAEFDGFNLGGSANGNQGITWLQVLQMALQISNISGDQLKKMLS